MEANNLRRLGPAVIENGYKIVDIRAGGKGCFRKGWQDNPLTAEDCEHAADGTGIGILCGYGEEPVVGLDFDFDGTEAEGDMLYADLTSEFPELENCPVRYSRGGRFLLLARAEKSWRKSVTAVYTRGESKAQLEVLGKGQQFVAFHIHPKTGKPYAWGAVSPLNTVVSDLPVLSSDTVERIKVFFTEEAKYFGFEPTGDESSSSLREADEFDVSGKNPVGLSLEEIRTLLEEAKVDWEDYSEWSKAGMRIHHETGASLDGLALWNELSSSAKNYTGPEECASRWESFNHSDSSNAVTMWPLVKQSKIMALRANATQLTERGLVSRAVLKLQGRAGYDPDMGTFLYFNTATNSWEIGPGASGYVMQAIAQDVIQTCGVTEIAKCVDDDVRKRYEKFWVSKLVNDVTASQKVLKTLELTPDIYVHLADFDQRSDVVGVRNGLVKLSTGELLPNTTQDRMVLQCDVEYDPKAECPTWEKALSLWFESDEVVDYVQRILGVALSGAPAEESLYLLVGNGANGKSCFLNTLSSIFGEYSASLQEETIFGAANSQIGTRSDLVALRGKRFAYCPETDDHVRFRASDVKRITGGDRITARAPYQPEAITFKPQFTMFISTNYEPTFQGSDDGMRRRIKVFKFLKDFVNDPALRDQRDPHLTEKLEEESAGIFNWLLEGYRKAQMYGVESPEIVRRDSMAYADTQDKVSAWFKTYCVEEEGSKISMRDAFASYLAILRDENEDTRDITQTFFTRSLNRAVRRVAGEEKIKRAGDGSRHLVGYALRSSPVEEADFDSVDEAEKETPQAPDAVYDKFLSWFDETVRVDEGGEVRIEDAFTRFEEFASGDENGPVVVDKKTFSRWLLSSAQGLTDTCYRSKRGGKAYLHNVSLFEEKEFDELI